MAFKGRKEGFEKEKHVCSAMRVGEWIEYSCPSCDYKLRKNIHTREIVVENMKFEINHSGVYMPENTYYMN